MRLTVFRHLPLACALAALAACNNSGGEAADAGTDATGQSAVPAASSPVTTAPPGPVVTTAPAAATAANARLSGFVGKYPFDKVDGVTFDQHPVVLAGIRKTVSDASARNAILEVEGPSAPIVLYQGKVAAWACEAHNCGDHQWIVMVDPNSGATDVCYHDAAKLPEKSRWFMADGSVDQRAGNCSVE